MKIIHVISGLGGGGAQVVLSRLLKKEKENHHIVISMMDEGLYGETIRNYGVDLRCLNFPKGMVSIQGILTLFKIIKSEKPDVVQTWMYHADFLGGIVAKLLGVKKIIWNLRNSEFNIKTQSFSTMIIAKCCALLSNIIPDFIIINSIKGKKFHEQLGYKKKLFTINNGFEVSNIIIENKNESNDFIFGMLARWDPQKDYDNLLISIKNFLETEKTLNLNKKIKIRFLLAGHNIDNKNDTLVKKINELNLTNKIELLGGLNSNEVEEFYKKIDVHILSSKSEGFPNVVAESMLRGVINIATDAGDSKNIIGNAGWIVETSSPDQLSEKYFEVINLKLTNLFEWNSLRKKSHEIISKNFGIDKMNLSFIKIWALREKKKVMHLISGLGAGGAQAVLCRLIKNEKDYQHCIVSLMDLGLYEKMIKEKKIMFFEMNMNKGQLNFLKFIRLIKIMRSYKPDIIQTWMYHADLIGGILGRLFGVKKIFWNIRNSNLDREWASLNTRILAKFCALLSYIIPNKVICCSYKSMQTHLQMGYVKKKFFVIQNGYEISNFNLIPYENKNKKIINFGMLARWDPQKDYNNLSETLKILERKVNFQWKMYLAGYKIEDNNQELIKIFTDKKIEDKIIFLGQINDLKRFFSMIDLHILSSAGNEGFPNVLAESMLFGIPCISTDVGDAKLIIKNSGWISPPKAPDILSNYILQASNEFFNDKENWNKRRLLARNIILENYDLKKMIYQYKNCWSNA
jgi:glycosyltransferase involved in cell wall biosynthesis